MSGFSILLADHNSAVLDEVRKVLAADYHILPAVRDGAEVVEKCLKLRPDVLILDISMGDISGIDLARQLCETGCKSQIIFLTIHDDPEFVRAAISTGALGYVLKSHLGTDLRSAVKAALAGKFFVSAGLLYQER